MNNWDNSDLIGQFSNDLKPSFWTLRRFLFTILKWSWFFLYSRIYFDLSIAFCSRKVNDWMIFCNKKNMHPFESFQGLFINCTTLDRWDRKIESPSDRNFIKYRNFRNTIFPYLFSYQISYIVKILPITHNTRKKFHVQTISPYHYSGNRGGIKIPPLAYTWLLGRMERVIL